MVTMKELIARAQQKLDVAIAARGEKQAALLDLRDKIENGDESVTREMIAALAAERDGLDAEVRTLQAECDELIAEEDRIAAEKAADKARKSAEKVASKTAASKPGAPKPGVQKPA